MTTSRSGCRFLAWDAALPPAASPPMTTSRVLTPAGYDRPRLQAHRDGRGELPDGLKVVLRRRAGEAERSRDLLPPQRAGDGGDRPERTGGVVAAVHVDAERQADGGVEARVVDGVEEV